MLKSRLVLIVLSVSVAVPTLAYPKWKDHPDQVIETPIGKFILTKLRTFHTIGILTVEGELVNDTPKNWDYIYFALEATDKNGKITSKQAPPALITKDHPDAFAGMHARNVTAGAHLNVKVNFDGVKADGGTLHLAMKYAFGDYPVRYKLALSKPVASDTLSFADDNVNLGFVATRTALGFTLQNKGDAPIKIDWNSVSFVSPSGVAQGVIHNGIKLADRTAPKAPSMVPPRARVEDEIVPVENIEWIDKDG